MEIWISRDGTSFRARRDGPGEITLAGEDDAFSSYQVLHVPDGGYAVETDRGYERAEAVRDGDELWVRWRGRTYRLEMTRSRGRARGPAGGGLSSPMPGQVQKLLVEEGAAVTAGQPLLVVEAMKMQLEIKAPHSGTVTRFLAEEGEQIQAGVALVELEEAS
jgi:biotin carboxyl carrier protein